MWLDTDETKGIPICMQLSQGCFVLLGKANFRQFYFTFMDWYLCSTFLLYLNTQSAFLLLASFAHSKTQSHKGFFFYA